MLFQKATLFLSSSRLAPYKSASNEVEADSLDLYFDNLRVAQSFYAPLSLLEVCLRNAVHEAIAAKLRSNNWLLEQQSGFMIDRRLTYFDQKHQRSATNDKVLRMVEAARREFKEKHGYEPPNGAAIIADLSLGFWTTLFTKSYFELVNKSPLNAFAYRPRGAGREVLSQKLQEVRLFRNRVYHYEPLCFTKGARHVLCISQIEIIHSTICDLLAWLDPDLPSWLQQVDRVPDTIKKLRKKHPVAT